jgi:hypothetical protein
LSETNKQKIYYKVATKNTAPYFVDLMTAMLCLTNMEWYSKFNGKNMGGILIPKVLNNTKKKTKSNSTTSKSKSTKPSLSLADLDIPLDLNLFSQSALHTNDDKFATIAWTTLDDVRREFFDIQKQNYYNIEDVKNIALKYNIKKEFYSNDRAAYTAALKYNILDECCEHMDSNYNWDFNLALNESKKYKKITELVKDNPKLWGAIKKYNWLNKLSLIDDRAKQWKNIDTIHKEALKYKTRGEFAKSNQSAYNAAKRLNIIDRVCSHMVELKLKKRTKSMCIKEAKKHIRKRDFSLANPSLYNFACKMGWIDECCKHMIPYAESHKLGRKHNRYL